MNERAEHQPTAAEMRQQERHDFHFYLVGAGLALLLTVLPFALVHWQVLPHLWMLVAIGVFALVQMVVHFRFFLHIGLKQNRDDLQLILFSALLLLIMVCGTLWIMASLAMRMGGSVGA